jgi:hypothetical protein
LRRLGLGGRGGGGAEAERGEGSAEEAAAFNWFHWWTSGEMW